MDNLRHGMTGKVCLVTGGTGGIGLATTRGLAGSGATVFTVGRDPGRGRAAAAGMRAATGNPAVEFIQADLSSLAEIRRAAEAIKAATPRLDVLVNNVGGFFLGRRRTVEGFEATYGLNYLGVFLLTNLLFERLRKSAPARIVNVASDSHRGARISGDNLQLERGAGGMRAYGQSKMAMVLFTYEAARRMKDTGVTINAMHPGFVATNIQKGAGRLAALAGPFIRLIARTPEQGADTVVYLAGSPDVEGASGKYFSDRRAVASDPLSYDERLAAQLWARTAQLVGLEQTLPAAGL